jgi:hypothetical protein
LASETIQVEKGRTRASLVGVARRRPLALVGASLVVAEVIVASLGGRFPALSALLLTVAPGLALLPLLPERARDSLLASLAAVPGIGMAAPVVALISLASAGAPLDGPVARLAVAGIVMLGLVLPGREPPLRVPRAELASAAGLLAAIAAGIVLQARVIAGSPVPGADWAQYILYADQVHLHGSLLIDNPFWMLGGRPFAQDPGVPALYGSYIGLTGLPAGVLQHGIWFFAVASVLSMFALLRPFWGPLAGVLGAALVAVIPISHDMLGWHGLANVAGLSLLPLVLLYLTALLRGSFGWTPAFGLALLLVAVAAVHRLSLLVCVVALGVALAAALLRPPRRRLLTAIGQVGVALLLLAPGVAYDLVTRQRGFGGLQGYRAYLDTKLDLELLARDLSIPLTVAGILGLLFLMLRRGCARQVLPFVAVLVGTGALAYSWLVHFPLAYLRMGYFVPLALVPLVAIALARAPRGHYRTAAGALLVAAIVPFAWGQARVVHSFYAFANGTSLRGANLVAARLRPGETVVTDRCWSFLAAWLVQRRTLSALESGDILPKSEVAPAREARAVLRGTREGRRLAKQRKVRFAMVDPLCADTRGRLVRQPPRAGQPVFVSTRLVVLRVGGG